MGSVSTVAAVIPQVAGTFAILVTLLGVGRWASRRWQSTVGLRRAQANLLNQLACGATSASVNALLGEPKFVREIDGRIERTYRLTGVWVAVEFEHGADPERGAPVIAFSITVSDPRRWFHAGKLTTDHLPIRLGRDRIGSAPDAADEWYWTGANRYGYLRHYYFGNPGGYQDFWLSHNMVGCGPSPSAFVHFHSGKYSDSAAARYHTNEPNVLRQSDVSEVAINTLTVLGPNRDCHVEQQFFDREVLGVEHSVVRLDRSEWKPYRPPLRFRIGQRLSKLNQRDRDDVGLSA